MANSEGQKRSRSRSRFFFWRDPSMAAKKHAETTETSEKQARTVVGPLANAAVEDCAKVARAFDAECDAIVANAETYFPSVVGALTSASAFASSPSTPDDYKTTRRQGQIAINQRTSRAAKVACTCAIIVIDMAKTVVDSAVASGLLGEYHNTDTVHLHHRLPPQERIDEAFQDLDAACESMQVQPDDAWRIPDEQGRHYYALRTSLGRMKTSLAQLSEKIDSIQPSLSSVLDCAWHTDTEGGIGLSKSIVLQVADVLQNAKECLNHGFDAALSAEGVYQITARRFKMELQAAKLDLCSVQMATGRMGQIHSELRDARKKVDGVKTAAGGL